MDSDTLFLKPTRENFCKYLDCDGDIHVRKDCGTTLLHLAIIYSYVDIAQLLIEKGADIYTKNNCERTPLHLAIIYSHVDIARLLIDNGADIHAKKQ